MDKQFESEHQWALYKVYRSNCLWFCKQLPMSFISHKWINPITGNYEGALNSCSAQDLKKNTEEWVAKTKSMWESLVTAQHPSALAAVKQHRERATMTMEEKPIGADTVEPNGLPKCYCPKCAIEEMKRIQNPELKLSL